MHFLELSPSIEVFSVITIFSPLPCVKVTLLSVWCVRPGSAVSSLHQLGEARLCHVHKQAQISEPVKVSAVFLRCFSMRAAYL